MAGRPAQRYQNYIAYYLWYATLLVKDFKMFLSFIYQDSV